ncbi:FMN-dependent NADH-azoreductase [Spelaeicoccus albus]|uniref:FMN dependent NADH:quinone oxidoreductase n=1 Tax=Spelaeicoccus albus TaxID=1280376 RepID=A0A7Z0D537_9MICO|nr:NAD(P)H-dependent oxidoreductase [Spelaeicoccus albus]NYI69041.1 FMN-dependent NADH-azoreductase [Spelaeicoccus albus]
MPTLLHLDSSADLTNSRSRTLSARFAEEWRAAGADHTVRYRDLHRRQLPHLADAALHWPERLRPDDANPPADAVTLQNELIDELTAADALVIGLGLYNYSMPSTLKAWIDHIHVPAVTAPFDVEVQPMAGKPALIITSRGAVYDVGTPTADWDHATPALKIILGEALGMDVDAVTISRTLAGRVPALAAEAERGKQEFDAALERVTELARRYAHKE